MMAHDGSGRVEDGSWFQCFRMVQGSGEFRMVQDGSGWVQDGSGWFRMVYDG